jgi:hypothetical protein
MGEKYTLDELAHYLGAARDERPEGGSSGSFEFS